MGDFFMMYKTCGMRDRCEYEKIKEEYNNLYGFDIGASEHKVEHKRNDLGLKSVKTEIKLKKG